MTTNEYSSKGNIGHCGTHSLREGGGGVGESPKESEIFKLTAKGLVSQEEGIVFKIQRQ